jgi:autotransporter passenger strand-loop-strand repeat protein
VFSGGIASGTVLAGGGTENIKSGGTGVSAVVRSGGIALVSSGGSATGDVG